MGVEHGPSNKVTSNLDFDADIEITGEEITNRRYNFASSGDNTLISVSAGDRLKLYKALLTVNADITGEVQLKVGSKVIGGVYNPKSGGQYILISSFPDFEHGADGENLVCNLPSATSVTVNTSYEVYTE
jgi:hypothetical protein